MAETTMTHTGQGRCGRTVCEGVAADWSSDQRAFKNVSWGKAMMWIFLLSDTFIFGCFLLSYMTARMSTRVPWPNPSEVFAPAYRRQRHPADPDRHHDLRADLDRAARWRWPSTSAIGATASKTARPDAAHGGAWRDLRRHAGLRVDAS